MADIFKRFRRAWYWARAISAYERSRYGEAVQILRASQNVTPLSLDDHVLLANALAGEGKHEVAASEYAICMANSAERSSDTSSFIFAYSAYMRATVTGDRVAIEHFGRQLAGLKRPAAFRAFVNQDWLP